jgi:hypothetical protein
MPGIQHLAHRQNRQRDLGLHSLQPFAWREKGWRLLPQGGLRAEDYFPLPPLLLSVELEPVPDDPEPLPEPVDPDVPVEPLVSLVEPLEPIEPLEPVEPAALDPVELPMLEPLPEEPEPEVSEPDVPGEDDPEADDASELPEPRVLELPDDGRDVLPLRPCALDLLRVADPVSLVSVEEEEVSDP